MPYKQRVGMDWSGNGYIIHYVEYSMEAMGFEATTFPPTLQLFRHKSYQQLYKVAQNKIESDS